MTGPRPGERFLDRYEVLDVLGRGGFATVFLARDSIVGRQVALKVLTPDHDGNYDHTTVSRFLREAKIYAGLTDPHTIVMFDFGRTPDGQLFMVFEYVRGLDLAVMLGQHGPMPERAAIHVLEQCLQALREAHRAGILHRDIKPANILVYEYAGDPLCVKVIDFGIAKPLQPPTDVHTITRTGTVIGTPRYMSPEQICGEATGPSSDVFALGLVVHELLTATPANPFENNLDVLKRQLDPVPFVLPASLGISPAFRALVARMCAKDEAHRYPDAGAVLADLDAILQGRPPGEAASGPMGEPTANSLPTDAEHPRVETSTEASTKATTAAILLALVATVGTLVAVAVSFVDEDQPPRPSYAAQTEPPGSSREQGLPTHLDVADAPVEDPRDASADPIDAESESDPPRCGSPPPFSGRRRDTIEVGGVRRTWRSYVPASYDPGRESPLVVALDSDFMRGGENNMIDEFAALSEEHGFVVVAPKTHTHFPAYEHVTDTEFVRGVIEATTRSLCIDPARIYLVGHASAGRAVMELRCHISFGAIAASGHRLAEHDELCRTSEKVPLMILNGINDPFTPMTRAEACNGRRVMPFDKEIGLWRRVNGCGPTEKSWLRDRNSRCQIYSEGCDQPVVGCRIDGGHYWPMAGSNTFHPIPGCQSPATEFPYAETVWRFFEEHGEALERSEPPDSVREGVDSAPQ